MLSKDQPAPEILANSISNQNIDLRHLRGKKVLIKFHRFSGCPVARFQVHEFLSHQKELYASGIETLLFLHNSQAKIVPILKEVPGLHIIPDKQKRFYKLYQSEFSISKLFSWSSWRITFMAILKGYLPKFNRFQGGIIGVPSDFLLDEQGRIADLHYGKHFGDSWTVAQVLGKSRN